MKTMIRNPFITSGYVSADYFCDRRFESEQLVREVMNGNNLALVSTRRMGKTGLIRHCFQFPEIKQGYYTFFIDIYDSRSLRDLVFALSKEILEVLKPMGKKALHGFWECVKSLHVCVKHMVNDKFTEEQARSYMKQLLPSLDYWKRYEELSDNGQFEAFKEQLIKEINDLHIEGLPKVEKLNALVGSYVNLGYPLPNGKTVKFLNDEITYLGNQLESEFGGDRCFGVLANMDFIMISTYGPEGETPELVLYKKR